MNEKGKDSKLIMGIVNINDDSYFCESRALDPESIRARTGKLMEEGADIIDIGACSTRPGSEYISEEDEWKRIDQALAALEEGGLHPRLSIDTFRAGIVQKVYDRVGDFIVNDISAGEEDADMLRTVGRLKLDYIAMHKRGTPKTMQSLCDYEDVVEEIIRYFREFAEKAEQNGIRNWILDPGFGFAKTVEQNYRLLKNLPEIKEALDRKILVGISRKSMITKYLGIATEDALPATSALHLYSMFCGADILRVHDVKEAAQVLKLYKMLNIA